MNTYNKVRKFFGCKWEYLGRQRLMWENKNVPNWVHGRLGGVRPGTIGQFKGKNYIYKVVREHHSEYGITPAKFYRRLRYKSWKRMRMKK